MTTENTSTDIRALLSTEEATVVSREAMLLKVRERHETDAAVAYGRRKGNTVCNRTMDPTKDHTDSQILALALKGA
jgi:hypothetical protein